MATEKYSNALEAIPVITGIGVVSSLGCDKNSTWNHLCKGKVSCAPIRQFPAQSWPIQVACEVSDDFSLSDPYFSKSILKSPPSRVVQFGLQAAFEAMTDAGLVNIPQTKKNLGVFVGAGLGSVKPQEILKTLQGHDGSLQSTDLKKTLDQNCFEVAELLARHHPHALTKILAKRWAARGPYVTISTACAAGAQSIARGAEAVRQGRADIVLAGGSDALCGEAIFAGFCMLGVLSSEREDLEKTCRPFDKSRQGFVAGEGAAFLVIESFASARQRGAPIYAAILGFGESNNAYRLTELSDDGEGARLSLSKAILSAPCQIEEIDLINAHGTGTEQNDRVELHAIEEIFAPHDAHPAITAHKPQFGHLIAASGAIEIAMTAMSIHKQAVPPIINLRDPIELKNYAFHFIRGKTHFQKIRCAISNSFGFGGTNCSVVLGEMSFVQRKISGQLATFTKASVTPIISGIGIISPSRDGLIEKDLALAPSQRKLLKLLNRRDLIAIHAAQQALLNSKIDLNIGDPSRRAIFINTTSTQIADYLPYFENVQSCIDWTKCTFDSSHFGRIFSEAINPLAALKILNNSTLAHLCQIFQIKGPNLNLMDEISSIEEALFYAFESVRRGEVDWAFAGCVATPRDPFSESAHAATRNKDRLCEGSIFFVVENSSLAITRSVSGAALPATLPKSLKSYDAWLDFLRGDLNHPK